MHFVRILSWDRDEEKHMLLEDVVVTYPIIAEAYKALCPNRMWLNRMAQKATSGHYHQDLKNAVDGGRSTSVGASTR